MHNIVISHILVWFDNKNEEKEKFVISMLNNLKHEYFYLNLNRLIS